MNNTSNPLDSKGRKKAQCLECGDYYHKLGKHIQKEHSMSVSEYKEKFPAALINSEYGASRKKKVAKKGVVKVATPPPKPSVGEKVQRIGAAVVQCRSVDEMDELDRYYIPKYDQNWIVDEGMKQFWEDLAIGIQDNEPVYIGGPTGCGKTEGVCMLAAALRQPVRRIQMNRDFRVAEFTGQRTLETDDSGQQVTGWKDGVFTEALRRGWWILLDEFDQAAPDVLMKFQSVLEGKPLALTENFGEIVEPHESFRIIATANTFGHGDDTGLYAGAKIMNEATLDRFGVVIKANYPSEKTEIKVLIGKGGIKPEDAAKMVACARKIREANAKEECSCTFSTRRLISWARKAKRYSNVTRAAQVAVLNRLSYEDSRFVGSIIQRHFGSGGVPK